MSAREIEIRIDADTIYQSRRGEREREREREREKERERARARESARGASEISSAYMYLLEPGWSCSSATR